MVEVEIVEKEKFQEIMSKIRNENEKTNWICLTYEGPKSKKLVIAGSGEGGVDELKTLFKDTGIYFAFARDFDKIDDSICVKFAFIEFIGDKSPRLQKAGVGMQLSSIQDQFGQFHITHMCSDLEDVSAEIILAKMKNASGSASHVL
ncbi:actin binding protein family protein [Entamoeba histolytica HM-1:IMSS-B]|uniref:Actin-binding protein, cofilin/tropomyosin family n=7 Tax=Entamoeba TaxID=5758 RepID=C4LVQ1_ENTH1|nr:uncharacterized protein EDI_310170 [Entamoeba dispar SAW760]XP_656437.1 actin-binding protein, cofilin/tropomyosin family [Entamoeba histolytica HM-1:IMSS]EMD46775.1 actinbinding protein cofilin/tropomyosin family protein [Entamoeba histolytica KU27]EMH78080.1 actin binding protein family protein [Entamoeba histolytica HM-1:IMSS-B]EMS14208.1 actin-binding protein, cofilin/tropomyosin family protein [Entamoeba histolytica HM-3:IMSS]ENY63333.1 actin-binding protein, cofilin/tropomyosin family|eukprot:EDR23786.1 hypothetical protein, conserved [Entamoeba dispar SAW760]